MLSTNNAGKMRKIIFLIIFISLVYLIGCNGDSVKKDSDSVIRHGWIIKIKPEKLEEYKNLHANVWPHVKEVIKECNINNYSIYHRDGYLFSYLEYTGNDWEADMKKMAEDSITQEWWKLTDPCQEKIETAKE